MNKLRVRSLPHTFAANGYAKPLRYTRLTLHRMRPSRFCRSLYALRVALEHKAINAGGDNLETQHRACAINAQNKTLQYLHFQLLCTVSSTNHSLEMGGNTIKTYKQLISLSRAFLTHAPCENRRSAGEAPEFQHHTR